ncbi:MAG: NUDIX domain-containing protein [Candidatus Niyogibacteria bacterium]|nr:NUDIX domain-containing protein [Candidatus Niyogibacteria bacterium]
MENHKLFEISQSAIIQDSAGRILILKKNKKWLLPGGRLEENETWLEGLQREVEEEAGIEKFSIKKILDIDTSDDKNTYIATFLCKVEDVQVKLSSEHQEYVWLNLKDIDKYEFWHEKIKDRLKILLGASQ